MEAREIIKYIGESVKKTPVKLYVREREHVDYGGARVFGCGDRIVFGDWEDLKHVLEDNSDRIDDYVIEYDCRNSAVPLLDTKDLRARIEPGAMIRDMVSIGENAVVMMGAVINIGAVVGDGSMIDMNAVIGGRACIGSNCHIGAGAVIAGVVEPASAVPVVIEDNVLIGANAVVIEGVRVGKGSVIGAGAVVTRDIPPGVVAVGCPARIIKNMDESAEGKTALEAELRKL